MENQEINLDIEKGKMKFIVFTVTFFLFVIASEIFAYSTFKEITTGSLYMSIIKILLEIGLIAAIYFGKIWAKYVMVGLMGLGAIFGITSTFALMKISSLALVILPLFLLYAYGVYLLIWDKYFLKFFESQLENN